MTDLTEACQTGATLAAVTATRLRRLVHQTAAGAPAATTPRAAPSACSRRACRPQPAHPSAAHRGLHLQQTARLRLQSASCPAAAALAAAERARLAAQPAQG